MFMRRTIYYLPVDTITDLERTTTCNLHIVGVGREPEEPNILITGPTESPSGAKAAGSGGKVPGGTTLIRCPADPYR